MEDGGRERGAGGRLAWVVGAKGGWVSGAGAGPGDWRPRSVDQNPHGQGR